MRGADRFGYRQTGRAGQAGANFPDGFEKATVSTAGSGAPFTTSADGGARIIKLVNDAPITFDDIEFA